MHIRISPNVRSCPGDCINVVLMGDTHEYHRDVGVPDGDLLIYVGDITRRSFSSRAVEDFDEWLGQLPHRWKVVIPGNHDYGFADPSWQNLITNAILLINDGVELLGLKIWGTPITQVDHGFFGGETAADREGQFKRIPADTDLLISHGPPYGILDREYNSMNPQGCRELLDAVHRVKPRLHAFGHIHGGYGVAQVGRTSFVNAAVAGCHGKPEKNPLLLCIPLRLSSEESGFKSTRVKSTSDVLADVCSS